MSNKDLYETFDIVRSAGDDEVKKIYRKLVIRHYPDRNLDNKEARGKFKEVQKAYNTLSDKEKRTIYGQYSHATSEQGAGAGGFDDFGGFGGQGGSDGTQGFGFSDILNQVFGDGAGDRQSDCSGVNLQVGIEISLKETAKGAKKRINTPTHEERDVYHGSGVKPDTSTSTCSIYHDSGTVHIRQAILQMQQTCPIRHSTGKKVKGSCVKCRDEGHIKASKTIEVNIPTGIDDDRRICLSDEGESGRHGTPAGDLHVNVCVRQHKIFEHNDLDLYCELSTSLAIATLGGEVGVLTLDDRVRPHIPKETRTGRRTRVKGKGVKSLHSSSTGGLYCHISTEASINLTDRQEELLEEFEEVSSSLSLSQTPHKRSFWERIDEKIGNLFSDN